LKAKNTPIGEDSKTQSGIKEFQEKNDLKKVD
jgi:hypothetical protein